MAETRLGGNFAGSLALFSRLVCAQEHPYSECYNRDSPGTEFNLKPDPVFSGESPPLETIIHKKILCGDSPLRMVFSG